MVTLSIQTQDEDELWMFERTVDELGRMYAHTRDEAISLVNRYYAHFTDPAFCSKYGLSVQGSRFFLREESLTMADRIEYYEALGNVPDEAAFIQWQRQRRL